MFSQCSDSHRALVDALDQGRSGRHLIQRAVRHLKVLCESSTNNVGYRLLGVPRMLLQNRPETSRQRAVKLRICPLCSVAHLFHSHFFLFETEISLGAAQISLLTRCFRWALYLRRRLLLWIKRDILSISFELASHHLVVHRRQPCQPLSIIRVAHSNFCMGPVPGEGRFDCGVAAYSPSATDRNPPDSAATVECRSVGRTHPEHLQLRDNVRLNRAPAKALRTAGRPTCCDRESVGSRHPFRSKRRGPSAAGAGNRPDENTPRKHPASA